MENTFLQNASSYKASGKFSPISIVIFLLLCVTAFPLLGTLYAYFLRICPFIYVNFLAAAGVGIAAGWLTSKLVMRFGKVRNFKLALLLGVLAGLVTLYFHWIVWLDILITSSMVGEESTFNVGNVDINHIFGLALNPSMVLSTMGLVNETGTWGFGNTAVSGTFLTIIWIIEFLIIMFFSITLSGGQATEPFCESDNKWFDVKNLPIKNYIENEHVLEKSISGGDSSSFDGMTNALDVNKNHSVFTLYSSNHENYLTVVNRVAYVNEKNETSYTDTKVVDRVGISKEMASRLAN